MTQSRGAALVLVLLALTLIGGFVAVAFVPSLEELRAGRNTLKLAQAAAAAEGGAEEVIAYWSAAGHDTLGPGDSALVGAAGLASRTGWYRGVVYRLGPVFYLMRVEGFSRDSLARRSIGVVLRKAAFETGIRSALAAEGPVILGPSMFIHDADSLPDGWPDCPQPVVSSDGRVGGDMLRSLLDSVSDRVASLPRLRLSSGTHHGWRSTSGFPVIEANGDVTLGGGVGRGVLLVHGSLTLEEDFEFYGPVFVEGRLRIRGGKVFGGVVAAGEGADLRLEKGALIYSRCLVAMGSNALGEVRRLGQRASFQLP